MSIRWVTSMLSLLLAVTIMVTAGLSWNVYSSFTKMVEADVQYQKLMQVSRELLQSSYDLTRKARSMSIRATRLPSGCIMASSRNDRGGCPGRVSSRKGRASASRR